MVANMVSNMVAKLVNQPLGMGVGDGLQGITPDIFSIQPKLWIASAIGAGVGLASSIIGGAKAASANKAAERRQRQQEAKEEAWYNRRYYEDYIDTAAGQNLARRAKEIAREQWKRAAGAQAVSGGTDAAVAQAKEAGNKMVGDTIANIAATDQARKANVDAMHRQAESQFAQQDMAREQLRAQNITQAAQGASNAITSAAGTIDQVSNQPVNLNGGGNNSVNVRDLAAVDGAKDAVAGMKEAVSDDQRRLFGRV